MKSVFRWPEFEFFCRSDATPEYIEIAQFERQIRRISLSSPADPGSGYLD
jgi:hypothetical protein